MLAAQALAERVARDQRFELADEVAVPPEQEIGFEPPLERVDPKLLEPCRLRRRERLRHELRERRPAPELERGPEIGRRLAGPAGVEARAGLRYEPLEAVEVERRPAPAGASSRAGACAAVPGASTLRSFET